MPEVEKCSSCGRAIIWATSPTGARLPLDARPLTLYWLTKDDIPNAIVVKAEVLRTPDLFTDPRPEEVKTYVSHFVTCPNAVEHSKARR